MATIDANGVIVLDGQVIDLEGPWNTYEEFLLAEKLRAQLWQQRQPAGPAGPAPRKGKGVSKKKKTRAGSSAKGQHRGEQPAVSTFALTAVGVESAPEDADLLQDFAHVRSQSSMATHAAPMVSPREEKPRAASSIGIHACETPSNFVPVTAEFALSNSAKVAMHSVGTQCRPRELEQDPMDRILRRYAFSLEWDHSSLGPGLLSSTHSEVVPAWGRRGTKPHARPRADETVGEDIDSEQEEDDLFGQDCHESKPRQSDPPAVGLESDPPAVGLDSNNAEGSAFTACNVGSEPKPDALQKEAEIAMSVGAPWQPEEELKASRRPLSASESRTLTNASSSGQNARRPWTGVIAPRSSEKKSIQDGSEQGRPSHAPRDRSRYIGSESHGSEEQRCAKTLTTQILSRVAPRGLHLEHSFAKKVTGSLKAKGGARGKSPGKLRELAMPIDGLHFYEVKLMEKEVVPTVDYTRDYRRFSYTDFKIPEIGEGKSTVDPELVADWLDRAVPRNQDDAYPLFILCKDLLRKFHQKEVRYAVQKEQDMMDEILMMKDALQGNRETLLSQKRIQEEENARLKTQLAVAEQKRLSTQEDLDMLRAEHEKYKKLEKEIDRLNAIMSELAPELSYLRQENTNLMEKLEGLMSAKDFEKRQALGKLEQKLESLHSELELHKGLATEAQRELLVLKNKSPLEWAQEWSPAQQVPVFKRFFKPSAPHGKMVKDAGKTQSEDVVQIVASSMTTEDFSVLPKALKMTLVSSHITELKKSAQQSKIAKATFQNQRDIKLAQLRRDPGDKKLQTEVQELEDTLALPQATLLETVSTMLGVHSIELFRFVVEMIRDDDLVWRETISSHQQGTGEAWTMVREGLKSADIQLNSLSALQVLSGVEQVLLLAQIVGIPADSVPMIRDNWPLFLKWFARFGPMGDKGLDEAEEERRRIREKTKKYSLLDVEHLDVQEESLSLEETLKRIGQILDFKLESDWENESEQRPRIHLARAVKSFMLRSFDKSKYNEYLKRFCAAVIKWSSVNPRIKLFGLCAGLVDVLKCWTERATCIWMLYLKELKRANSPGIESQDPSTFGNDWNIFAPWLGTPDKTVELTHAVAAGKAAVDSDYAFGDMPDYEPALLAAANKGGILLDKASEIFMEMWFQQHAKAHDILVMISMQRARGVEIFHHFDKNDDGSLDLQEFLSMLKRTPLKIRQHDAMNMFHELAGPDGTMDDEEFSEILVFYKFNTRGLLSIDLGTSKSS